MPSTVLLSVLLVVALTAAGMLGLQRRQRRVPRPSSIELLPAPSSRRAGADHVWTAHQAPSPPAEVAAVPPSSRAPVATPDEAVAEAEIDPEDRAWSRQILSRLQQDRPAAS